jgi:signal transduction histidine kinase
METLLWLVGIVVAGAAGWFFARSSGPDVEAEVTRRADQRVATVLDGLATDLEAGEIPTGAGDPPGMERVRAALEEGWALRDEERRRALREALGRIAAFLREEVEAPLREVRGPASAPVRDGVDHALGALQDLEFYLREPLTPDETHDLIPVVQQVTREFTSDWDVAVRFQRQAEPVRARIHRDSFLDALYLLLHNAGQFGEGQTVDVQVEEQAGRAVVTIRDRGPGFTPEALDRAHDLFYSTTESGLGLGIPFARRIVESFGGDVDLRNLPDRGGAEVRLSLPSA